MPRKDITNGIVVQLRVGRTYIGYRFDGIGWVIESLPADYDQKNLGGYATGMIADNLTEMVTPQLNGRRMKQYQR